MSDNLPAQAGEQNPPATSEGGQQQQPTTTPDTGLNAKFKLLEKQLEQMQRENSALKKAEEDRKTAKLSEIDKLKSSNGSLSGEVDSLKGKLEEQAKAFAFKLAASKAGCVNPDAACKLADLSTLIIDEHNEISGTSEYLEVFKGEHAYFFGTPKPTPTVTASGGGNPTSGAPQPASPADLNKMSRQERADYFSKVEGRKFY